MAEDLNNFAQYQTFSSYSTVFNNTSSPAKSQPLRRNPLEYYSKRGIDPPKTIHGDPTKILEPLIIQKPDQPKEAQAVGSIHLFATEINQLCLAASQIIQKPQQIKDQLNGKHKKQTSQTLLIQPNQNSKNENPQHLQIENEFQQNQKKEMNQFQQSQLDGGFQNNLQNNNRQVYQKQDLQLSLSPSNEKNESIIFQQQKNNLQFKEEPQIQFSNRNVQQLYQRNHKSVVSTEEQSKKIKNNSKPYVSSLTELSQHQDEEIQKAIQVLMIGKKS